MIALLLSSVRRQLTPRSHFYMIPLSFRPGFYFIGMPTELTIRGNDAFFLQMYVEHGRVRGWVH